MSLEIQLENKTLSITQGDITDQKVDAIVNAANSSLMGGGGVDGAIHRAGGPSIKEECKVIVSQRGRLPTGKAVITSGGELSASHVIHTVGPIYRQKPNDPKLLESAYRESLNRAEEGGLETVAFPSISTGAYGYPVEKAAKIALKTVMDHLKKLENVRLVRFVLFDNRTYRAYEKEILEAKPQ